ncbi:serine/threonine protein kinase [Saprolegnia parasitica CBS 223.65]|uniref:Serine/threonine protein kinase n=1 Tax=Saprolegnia parasitica (strain CBS 223.65) TaxID=695850 RepID=A0A067C3I7_SAPPC|nr:serine/threonine protein kinase [Saprolegnia parasitica CBS 223.65]KDO25088.1 serine/threonine protein kinase [Saprolegnia parasitica CBS 223.65]|eukprot:XP_012204162.1 serine/threonine protein kinase [Saprolegnia parasitica CBS 223.65]
MGVRDWFGLGDESKLARAAGAGDLSLVTSLLGAGVNANGICLGVPALYKAVVANHAAIARLLVEAGANPDLPTWTKAIPLVAAVVRGHTSCAALLIEAGASLDVLDRRGDSPLYIAADGGYADIVRLLIAGHANVNLCNATGQSPLFTVALHGYSAIVQDLLAADANYDCANQLGQTPLLAAAMTGRNEIVALLVSTGAQIDHCNHFGHSAVFLAVYKGHVDVVAQLVAARANVNLSNDEGCTPLFIAAKRGLRDTVKLLLDAGASAHLSDKSQNTPLLMAANGGYTDIVSLLVVAKADVNQPNQNKDTPLIWAADRGHAPVVQCLLAAKANANHCNTAGRSALLVAARGGHAPVVELLLVVTADINKADINGETAIYTAARRGHLAVVKLLVAAGANTHLPDKVNPLTIARQNGHHATVRVLLAAQKAQLSALKPPVLCLVKLGRGRHGDVFKSSHLGHTVAIKTIYPTNDATFLSTLNRAQQLDCPQLARYHGIVHSANGTHRIAIEYVDGGSVRDHLAKLQRGERTPISTPAVAMAAARGLVALHAAGLVHGRLTSSNIFLSMTSVAKLTDYSLDDASSWTRSSAPEVLAGYSPTSAADIYAFGLFLVEIETRQVPYPEMHEIDVLAGVKQGTLQPECTASVAPWYRNLVLACVQADPVRRPTAADVLRCLESNDK